MMDPRLMRPSSGLHPDAENWATRVAANGGSVSDATLDAVSRFCVAISAAGIRSRFHRLNLLCGNTDAFLYAVRTPLYVGDAIGVAVGNALDANVGPFAQADYQERGTSGGLDNATGSKHLSTGLAPNNATLSMPQDDCHLSAYGTNLPNVVSPVVTACLIGVRHTGATNRTEMFARFGGNNSTRFASDAAFGVSVPEAVAPTPATQGHLLGASSSDVDIRIAVNGVVQATQTNARSIGSLGTGNVFVFCHNNSSGGGDGTAQSRTAGRLMGYSIGKSLTNAQVLSFYDAMQAFQTALQRQVT